MLSTDESVLQAHHYKGLGLQAEAGGPGSGFNLQYSQASTLFTLSAGEVARLQASRPLPACRPAQQAPSQAGEAASSCLSRFQAEAERSPRVIAY